MDAVYINGLLFHPIQEVRISEYSPDGLSQGNEDWEGMQDAVSEDEVVDPVRIRIDVAQVKEGTPVPVISSGKRSLPTCLIKEERKSEIE